MTQTYSPFSGVYGDYAGSPEHSWFSWNQPIQVDPGTTSPTHSGGFLGAGFPSMGGGGGFFRSLQFDPMMGVNWGGPGPAGPSGTGVGGVGPTSDGLAADANAQSVVSIDNASSPTATTANSIGRAVMGLVSPVPGLISIAHQLAKMIAQSNQSNPVGMPSPQETKAMDPIGNPGVGSGEGVGNTSGQTANDANPGVSSPSEAASSPGPAGTTAEGGGAASSSDGSTDGGTWKRGGYIRNCAEGGLQRLALLEGDSLPWQRVKSSGTGSFEDAIGTDMEGRQYPMGHPAWVREGSSRDRGLYPYAEEWERAQHYPNRRSKPYKRAPLDDKARGGHMRTR